MGRAAKKTTKQGRGGTLRSESRSAEAPSASAGRGAGTLLPEWLTRSSIYKKVPVAVRGRLDEAILLRPAKCATLEQIAEKFELSQRYGLSHSSLRSYARKLEKFVRPAAASQLMAGVLGCLPEGYRRRLVAGGQVLLLSRVVQALSAEGGAELSVAELAKLASVLSAVGSRSRLTADRAKAAHKDRPLPTGESGPKSPAGDPVKLAEAVRMLYGLPWPPDNRHPE